MALSRRRLIAIALFLFVAIALLYVAAPAVAGIEETWDRLRDGDPWWLAGAFALEVLSFASYMALFRAIVVPGPDGGGWLASYRITMAGLAATRLLATAGAGGVVLTVWALRRSGMAARTVARRYATFLGLLYGVYMASVILVGVGLAAGVLPGPSPVVLTVVPAVAAGLVTATALGVSVGVDELGDPAGSAGGRGGGSARARALLGSVPATIASGVRGGIQALREPRPGLLGALGWWAFDIAVLWACFRAFGDSPEVAVVVISYFVGMAANTLPIPGGIGGIEGGMVGCFTVFGVPAGLALVAVLSYRAFALWIPLVPGVIAYFQLLRTATGSDHVQ